MTDIAATPATIRAVAAALGRARLYDDKLGNADAGRIAAWAEVVDQYDLDQDDLIAGVVSYYTTNHDGRAMQVSDLVRHSRAHRADRSDRAPLAELDKPRVPDDEHYPGDAKAAPDPAPYPADWTVEQRTSAYWYAVTLHAMPHTTAGWVGIAKQLERKRAEREGAPT